MVNSNERGICEKKVEDEEKIDIIQDRNTKRKEKTRKALMMNRTVRCEH